VEIVRDKEVKKGTDVMICRFPTGGGPWRVDQKGPPQAGGLQKTIRENCPKEGRTDEKGKSRLQKERGSLDDSLTCRGKQRVDLSRKTKRTLCAGHRNYFSKLSAWGRKKFDCEKKGERRC